jgi:hypothetical protein
MYFRLRLVMLIFRRLAGNSMNMRKTLENYFNTKVRRMLKELRACIKRKPSVKNVWKIFSRAAVNLRSRNC